jgi:pyruvate carboxylase subunit B
VIKKKVKVMVTAFRDGFQSVFGARVLTKDFIPAVEACREAGINHYEAGGGARFQSLYFYCNEDAFDMMEAFRTAAGPDANLQTLARGVNVVGLDSQPSDIVKLHAQLFKKHGITTIRNFDALNDVNNLDYSGRCIHEAGLKHEAVVTMMSLPPGVPPGTKAHTAEFYVKNLQDILDAKIPFDSVCFKDASGTSTPRVVHDTIKQARRKLPMGTRLVFHTHDTAGTGTLCYQAALDGGADQIDLSLAPVSGGTAQPDLMSMWHALRGTEFDLGFDIDKVREAEEVFKECMRDYFVPPESKAVEPLIPMSPMPGGALTANTQMMRDNNMMDKYPDVIKAMREVVERGGYGTSVTPVSQFYYQQAFNNVIAGPWKKIAAGYGDMVLGYFGKTPVEPDPEIVKIAAEQLGKEPTKKTVLEINDADPRKGAAQAREALEKEGLPVTDENVFIVATCREKGIYYLKGEAKIGVRKSGGGCTVTLGSKRYSVVFKDNKAIVNGKPYEYDVKDGVDEAAAAPAPAPEPEPKPAPAPVASGDGVAVTTPHPGMVLRTEAKVGERLKEGDVILVLEAMKMETEIKSPQAGTLIAFEVSHGDQVSSGQVLARIQPG